MCDCKNYKSPVLHKKLQEGYTECFDFVGNELICENDLQRVYLILLVQPVPVVCVDAKIIVYLFRTPDRHMGHAILPLERPDDD